MPTVKIPPVLRPRTGGADEVAAAGETVGEVLSALSAAHPDTRDQLFGADGELNRYLNVYLNDEDVRVLDGLETPVSESDTVVILPAMAGGKARSRPPGPHPDPPSAAARKGDVRVPGPLRHEVRLLEQPRAPAPIAHGLG
jgi:sulfur-carrier protein